MSEQPDQATQEEARKAGKPLAESSAPDLVDGVLDLGEIAATVMQLGSQVGGACVEVAKIGASGAEVVTEGALGAAKVAGEIAAGAVGAVGDLLSGLGDLG
jgi:hypothetical protein